jgi:metal-responsive CopG/Arc/MetJ family transcriptional regulator
MSSRKTAISIDQELFSKADDLARDMGVSRSQLFARALEAYLRQCEDVDLLAEINEAYSKPETPAERKRRTLTRSYMRDLAEGEW